MVFKIGKRWQNGNKKEASPSNGSAKPVGQEVAAPAAPAPQPAAQGTFPQQQTPFGAASAPAPVEQPAVADLGIGTGNPAFDQQIAQMRGDVNAALDRLAESFQLDVSQRDARIAALEGQLQAVPPAAQFAVAAPMPVPQQQALHQPAQAATAEQQFAPAHLPPAPQASVPVSENLPQPAAPAAIAPQSEQPPSGYEPSTIVGIQDPVAGDPAPAVEAPHPAQGRQEEVASESTLESAFDSAVNGEEAPSSTWGSAPKELPAGDTATRNGAPAEPAPATSTWRNPQLAEPEAGSPFAPMADDPAPPATAQETILPERRSAPVEQEVVPVVAPAKSGQFPEIPLPQGAANSPFDTLEESPFRN